MTAVLAYLSSIVIRLNDTEHNRELKEHIYNINITWELLLKGEQ